MTREIGTLNLPGNIEPQIASSLDARSRVPLKADLTNDLTFGIFAYIGMNVNVYNDTEDNNGTYSLKSLPSTNSSNWVKIVMEKDFFSVDNVSVKIDSLEAPVFAGVITLPSFVDNEDGSITLSDDGVANFCTTADGKSNVVKLNLSNIATLTLTDMTVNYVYVYYNNGNPIFQVATSPSIYLTDFRKIPLYRIVRNGVELCTLDYDEYGSNYALKNLYKDISINSFQRLTGLELSTTATRISTIGEGSGWFGGTFKNLSENKVNTSGQLFEYYLVNSVWNRREVTAYDSQYYSDSVDRKDLDSGKYVAKYFYRFVGNENKACYFHGNQYITKNEAIIEEIPAIPNIVSSDTIFVGKIVIQQGATNGTAYSRDWNPPVNISDSVNFDDVYAFQNAGIDQRTPILPSEISIDYTNRIVTITPTKGEFNYFLEDGNHQMIKHIQRGALVFPAFSNTSGLWYFYIDNNGVARATQNIWTNFSTQCPILRISWNSTKSTLTDRCITLFYEAHTNTISAVDHLWKHSFGAVWVSGFNIFSNPIATGTPNADGRNTCFSLSGGTTMDDNLPYTAINTITPTTFWEQDLGLNNASLLTISNGGIFNIRYKGVNGEPELVTGTRFPFLFNPVNNIPQYVNTSGARVDVPSGSFFVYFTYSIQDYRVGEVVRVTPYYGIFSNITDARNLGWDAVQLQDTNAKDMEIRVLYKNVYEYRSNFPAAIKYTANRNTYDLRKMIPIQGSVEI